MVDIRRLLGMLLIALWTAWSHATELRLLRQIPIRDLTPLPEAMLKGRDGFPGSMTSDFAEYGFIRGGKTVFLGHQGWAYDLEKDKVFRLLSDAFVGGITADGKEMLIETRNREVFWQDSEDKRTPGPKDAVVGGFTYIHPGGQAVLSWCEFGEKQVHGRPGPELRSLTFFSKDGSASMNIPVNVPKDPRTWIDDTLGFTGDGKYVIATPYLDESITYRFLDIRTKRFVPIEVMGDVFNHDASLVAGFSSAFDSEDEQIALFLWDLKAKRYIWKGKAFGGPEAFSPNNKHLLTRGGFILLAATGEILFQGLKGKTGKFSPDGRSLVTVDDEAFYIYTLPKDSEPIFGVFQAPDPWSPPKRVKRTAPSLRKPLKKP